MIYDRKEKPILLRGGGVELMKIAFDIDGTITEVPKQMKELIRMHDSVILTGSLNPNATIDGRIEQLRKYDISDEDFDEIVQCIGIDVVDVAKKKGEYCRDNNIDLIFEDSPLYTFWISRISPQTACFLIHEDKYFNQ